MVAATISVDQGADLSKEAVDVLVELSGPCKKNLLRVLVITMGAVMIRARLLRVAWVGKRSQDQETQYKQSKT